MRKAYGLSADEIGEVLDYMRWETDPGDGALTMALEDAKHWETALIVLSLFVARVLERYQGQSELQSELIESLHDPMAGVWLEIQEMDHHYVKQLLVQDPGAHYTLDEILTSVAERIAVHDYA